jgi:hypothetical protein
MIRIIIDSEWFSKEKCYNNPKYLYIYGDNLLRKGGKGQAIIRTCYNSAGITTKRYPSNCEGSFFLDADIDEFKEELEADISYIFTRMPKYEALVFPKDGLGTGLAALPTTSPLCFKYLSLRLEEITGYKHNSKGFSV